MFLLICGPTLFPLFAARTALAASFSSARRGSGNLAENHIILYLLRAALVFLSPPD